MNVKYFEVILNFCTRLVIIGKLENVQNNIFYSTRSNNGDRDVHRWNHKEILCKPCSDNNPIFKYARSILIDIFSYLFLITTTKERDVKVYQGNAI